MDLLAPLLAILFVVALAAFSWGWERRRRQARQIAEARRQILRSMVGEDVNTWRKNGRLS